jgi:3-hydroxybutyryl-CoA dehydrogenase
MKIVVITGNSLKEELTSQGCRDGATIEWNDDIYTVPRSAPVYIDLMYDETNDKRIEILTTLTADVILVNNVTTHMENFPGNFIRFNGWPTFLKREVLEAHCANEDIKKKAEMALSFFNKTIEWTADINGFITPRVVCAIINEAFFSVQSNVSSREEIDMAMKLGTNYPYGPFEWNNLIGPEKVYSLLSVLSKENERYTPCDLLKKEIVF